MENETHVVLKAQKLMSTARTGMAEVTEFVTPEALTPKQLMVVRARVGAGDYEGARMQYTTLYYNRHTPAVRRELERIHAKFIAQRLKESQI